MSNSNTDEMVGDSGKKGGLRATGGGSGGTSKAWTGNYSCYGGSGSAGSSYSGGAGRWRMLCMGKWSNI